MPKSSESETFKPGDEFYLIFNPQLAPENTKVSFETALDYDVYGFESDVSIR